MIGGCCVIRICAGSSAISLQLRTPTYSMRYTRSQPAKSVSAKRLQIRQVITYLRPPPQVKKAFTLDQLFRAIEMEKAKSMDESRSPLERTQSMRVRRRACCCLERVYIHSGCSICRVRKCSAYQVRVPVSAPVSAPQRHLHTGLRTGIPHLSFVLI